MQTKTIVLATFLTASLAIGSTAQAHDDYGYPIGVLSGVILGLSLDHGHNHNHNYYYRERRHRHYPHREYRRQRSHGFQYGGRYKRHRHERDRRHHRD